MLGKSPIKWRLCPDMTLAVDWDVKHQFKQTNLLSGIFLFSFCQIKEKNEAVQQFKIVAYCKAMLH